jgi:ketosteroid isomerase-like protein
VNEPDDGINRTLSEWSTAFSIGDVEALVSLVNEDAEFWTHGMPAIVGRPALRDAFSAFFDVYSAVQEFNEVERIIGD